MLGWGRLSGSGSSPDILQQAEIPIVSHEECKKKYNRYDSKAHLCAGQGHSGGSGGCQGDSGGPLVCEKGGTWFLHGAVSFGKRGCPTKYNTVFARITTYIPWIMDKLGKGYMFIYSALSLTVLSPGKGCEKRNKPWFLEGKTEFFTILVSEVSRGKPNLNEMKLERRLVGFLLLSHLA